MKPMKQYITLFALQLIVIAGWAQKLTVEGMTLVEDDQSAVMEKRTDIGGNPCALVKVKMAAEGAAFGGNVIQPVNYRDGEYWVFMTENSYLLQVKHSQFQPLMVNFRDFGINKVVAQKTYRLTINAPQSNVTIGKLEVAYTPSGAEVFLDGLRLGTTPLVKEDVSPGAHKVVIKLKRYPTERKDIVVNAGQTVRLTGYLDQSHEDENMSASQMTARGENLEGSNIDKAISWYVKAAELGDPEAMVNLGRVYYMEKKNTAQAEKWFRMAADMGDSDGQWWLGKLYFEGLSFIKGTFKLKKDYDKAFSLYLKSAEQNNATGQRLLGEMYENGLGVKKNLTEAAMWYRKAAEQEEDEAQYLLGLCYEKGKGVRKDKEQAYYWYKKAFKNHNYHVYKAYYKLKSEFEK